MTVCEVIRIHFTVCDHLSPHTAWPRSSILFVNNTVNHPWTCEITLHSILFTRCICSFMGQHLLEHQLRNYVFIIMSTDTIFQSNYLCYVFTGEKTILNRCLKRVTKLFSIFVLTHVNALSQQIFLFMVSHGNHCFWCYKTEKIFRSYLFSF